MAKKTRSEGPANGDPISKGKVALTRLEDDGGAGATLRESPNDGNGQPDLGDGRGSAPSGAGRNWIPGALASEYRIVHAFDAAGGQADAFLVENGVGEQFFLKIYRRGIQPKSEVLERISSSAEAHVIKLHRYGESDGYWYELLEYARLGTLGELINTEGPKIAVATVKDILKELHAALAHIHSQNIEHRDLKPENVLVRTRKPLDLVLTDFGIASLHKDSVHYSKSADRTLDYAPPEAGSATVYRTAWDFWSLGMILVEVLTGQHPFHELNEQMVGMRLATQPVDELVEGVKDGEWKKLCRGLLRREPKKRWGHGEVEKWLKNPNDETLIVADDATAQPAVRPFPFQGENCQSKEALAVALAASWEDALSEWKGGRILRWVKSDLRDYDLERKLEEIDKLPEATPDNQLFRIIHAMDPDHPLSFMGMELTEQKLTELADLAPTDERAVETLWRIWRNKILDTADELRGFDEFRGWQSRWNNEVNSYAEERKKLLKHVSQSTVPDLTRNEPTDEEKRKLAILLAATISKNHVIEGLRQRAIAVATRDARLCQWFADLGDPETVSAPALFLMSLLANEAEQYTCKRKEKENAERAEKRKKYYKHIKSLSFWIVIFLVSFVAGWSGNIFYVGLVAGLVSAIWFQVYFDNHDPIRTAFGAFIGALLSWGIATTAYYNSEIYVKEQRRVEDQRQKAEALRAQEERKRRRQKAEALRAQEERKRRRQKAEALRAQEERKRRRQKVVRNTPTARSDPRPKSVLIPNCADGWSTSILKHPSYGRMKWEWPVRAQYLKWGKWVDIAPHARINAFEFRYCSYGKLAGKKMPLLWSKIGNSRFKRRTRGNSRFKRKTLGSSPMNLRQ